MPRESDRKRGRKRERKRKKKRKSERQTETVDGQKMSKMMKITIFGISKMIRFKKYSKHL